MNWILGITYWLFVAALLFYLCVAIDHFVYGDLLERRASQTVKHPRGLVMILCLLLSANIVLLGVKAIEHRAPAIEARRALSFIG
jgi:hypothetical protein